MNVKRSDEQYFSSSSPIVFDFSDVGLFDEFVKNGKLTIKTERDVAGANAKLHIISRNPPYYIKYDLDRHINHCTVDVQLPHGVRYEDLIRRSLEVTIWTSGDFCQFWLQDE